MHCNRTSQLRMWTVYIGLTLLAGCFPEDALDWSADGSRGLLSSGGKLYLVDGDSGALTPMPVEKAGLWPEIAPDGSQIVFSEEYSYATLEEGLKALPSSQAKMVAAAAQNLYEEILRGDRVVDGSDASLGDKFGLTEPYCAWVVRLLCENTDEQFTQKLGVQVVQKAREAELACSRVTVMSCSDFTKKEILTISVLDVLRTRFSPDGRNVAYLTVGPDRDEKTATLLVVSRSSEEPVCVASGVGLGYDWRPDSQAIAYLRQDEGTGTTMLGAIHERRVCDSDGKLSAETLAGSDSPFVRCTGESKQLVGTLFDPLMKVEYGAGGRVFFSSPSVTIPSSDLDESKYSVFCYDALTGMVSNVLPSSVAGYVGEGVSFFSLSPDGTRLLLPLKENRFGIYELGTKSFQLPIQESEKFDDDAAMIPVWKGSRQVTCQVSSQSRFVKERAEQNDRKEIVVLNAAGDFQGLLSGSWPNQTLPGASENDN